MSDTFKVITCPMKEAEGHLNANAEEWALHMFLPTTDTPASHVTIVMISQRVLRMNQIGRGN